MGKHWEILAEEWYDLCLEQLFWQPQEEQIEEEGDELQSDMLKGYCMEKPWELKPKQWQWG